MWQIRFAVLSTVCVLVSACASTPTASNENRAAAAATTVPVVVDGQAPLSTAPGSTGSSEVVSGEGEPRCAAPDVFVEGRTDQNIDGNPIVDGRIDLDDGQVEIALPGEASWIIPNPADAGGWYVTLADGQAVRVSADGSITDLGEAPQGPPEADAAGNLRSAFTNHELFVDPIPDARVVGTDGFAVTISGPTDQYAHGVLGDAIEGSAIEVVELCTDERSRIEIVAPDVIEGVAPLLADIDDDGEVEILVTVSNSDVGARLAMFELDGTLLAESAPIGQGNRWRNQLAIGPFGLNGELEVIDVQTPHIGGIVQSLQLIAEDGSPRLELTARTSGDFTSHVIRSRNLNMGLAVDVAGDGRPEVLVPTFNRNTIAALTRTDEGWGAVGAIALPDRLSSNLVTQTIDGRTLLAAGADDVLVIVG